MHFATRVRTWRVARLCSVQCTVQWNRSISETVRNRKYVYIHFFFVYNDRYNDLQEHWPLLLKHSVSWISPYFKISQGWQTVTSTIFFLAIEPKSAKEDLKIAVTHLFWRNVVQCSPSVMSKLLNRMIFANILGNVSQTLRKIRGIIYSCQQRTPYTYIIQYFATLEQQNVIVCTCLRRVLFPETYNFIEIWYFGICFYKNCTCHGKWKQNPNKV
jgi:hypothetical protein